MNVSGVVIHLQPGRAVAVRAAMAQLPGVEIHAAEGGRFVATVEDVDGASVSETFIRLHDIPGVIAVSLAYQYCDDPAGSGPIAAEPAIARGNEAIAVGSPADHREIPS
jgi:nitrate reductase NapD